MIHVQIAGDCLGSLDILALRGFIATAQQDNDDISAMNEVDPVTWALINPKLSDSIEKLCISKESSLQPDDTLRDTRLGLPVFEVFKPIPENRSLAHFHSSAPDYSQKL